MKRTLRSSPDRLAAAKARRAQLAADGKCINGDKHPAPVNGVRCWLCIQTHRGVRAPRADRRAA